MFGRKNKIKVKTTKIKLKPNECVCDLINKGIITSGYCHKHKTDWI